MVSFQYCGATHARKKLREAIINYGDCISPFGFKVCFQILLRLACWNNLEEEIFKIVEEVTKEIKKERNAK